jgi:hypothetical protein
MNRKLRNIKVYLVLKRIGQKDSIVTKLFMKLFNQQNKSEEQQSATDRLR